MDIAEWLSGMGLEHYAQAFEDAEITPEVLSELERRTGNRILQVLLRVEL